MNLIELFKRIKPYVYPYRWLVIVTLILTLIGSLMAQVNAIVLDRTVDAINALINPLGFAWSKAARILTIITIVLLGKEILSAGITFAQNFFGEKMRINVSKDLSQAVIDRMLTYRMGFFSAKDNETGKLQTRIDQGVSSLSSTVQNFFIDLLPLFTSAVLALILMFAANVYVGLTALMIVPIYIFITIRQARKLQGWRRNMRTYREQKSHGVKNIIDSMNVIKSFNREGIESEKQWNIQTEFSDNQMLVRKTSFYYDGMKSFVRQIGTVLIIILTAYLVLNCDLECLTCARKLLVSENVCASNACSLTNVCTVCKMDTLGNCDNNIGVLLKSRSYVSEELVHIEVSLGEIYKIGSDSVYDSADSGSGGKPARITSHNFNDGYSLGGVNRAVANDLLHCGGDILCRRAEAGSVVGYNKVVVDGLGHAHDSHLVIVILQILGKLCNGIHRIVAADIEEVSDIIFLEDGKELFVNFISLTNLGKLFTARAESRRGGVLKLCDKSVICKIFVKVNESFLEKSLNTVSHSVKSLNASVVNIFLHASDNSGKS